MNFMKSIRRLIIIGNGFDLYHELPTSFADFIKTHEYYADNEYFKRCNGLWNTIETTIGNMVSELKQNFEVILSNISVDDIVTNIISDYGYHQNGYVDYHNYEFEDFNDKLEDINKLIKFIFDLENDFKNYLLKSCQYCKIKKNSFFSSVFDSDESSIINFNYTRTLQETYGLHNVHHIHGCVKTNIKIGYNSEISDFNMTLGDMNYLRPKDIKVESKDDLVERFSRYEEVVDLENEGTYELVPLQKRYEFHYEVKSNIDEHKKSIQVSLFANDKSKFKARTTITELIKETTFDEVVIIGHSIGEMDMDFFTEILAGAKVIKCSFYDKEDYDYKANLAKKKIGIFLFLNLISFLNLL